MEGFCVYLCMKMIDGRLNSAERNYKKRAFCISSQPHGPKHLSHCVMKQLKDC
uniref:Uncharacterized protein n=1 Tax=Octopus bimaculoides TaxID=37653 RepID=A0A0L8HP28_OCTBM